MGIPAGPACFYILASPGRRVKGAGWSVERNEQAGGLWGDITAGGGERRLSGAAWRLPGKGQEQRISGELPVSQMAVRNLSQKIYNLDLTFRKKWLLYTC